MKKTLIALAIPAAFALTACGETATEEAAETETAAVDNDNDSAAPEAAPVAEEEPHDESVPHEH